MNIFDNDEILIKIDHIEIKINQENPFISNLYDKIDQFVKDNSKINLVIGL